LGFTIIHSIVDFVDFVKDDSKKGKRKVKLQYAIFFFFGRQSSLLKFVEGVIE
jgi:hypothetical protein